MPTASNPLPGTSGRPVALVTGASLGIGRDLATIAAERGHDVVLVARNREKVAEVAAEIAATTRVLTAAVSTDLSTDTGVDALLTELGRNGISIDLLVNNAGFGVRGDTTDLPLEDQLGMIRLNVEAVVHLTASLLPAMVSRGGGAILNVASTAAFQPGPGMAVYYATKAFALSWSEALTVELADSGIQVTALCPGPTPTGFQDRAGVTLPDDVPDIARKTVLLDSRSVAEAGMNGLEKGKAVVVPGMGNRAATVLPRLAPRSVVAKMSKAIADRI